MVNLEKVAGYLINSDVRVSVRVRVRVRVRVVHEEKARYLYRAFSFCGYFVVCILSNITVVEGNPSFGLIRGFSDHLSQWNRQ